MRNATIQKNKIIFWSELIYAKAPKITIVYDTLAHL